MAATKAQDVPNLPHCEACNLSEDACSLCGQFICPKHGGADTCDEHTMQLICMKCAKIHCHILDGIDYRKEGGK